MSRPNIQDILYSNMLEGSKNFFNLTVHSITFYIHLYGIGYMVMDHSDSERKETHCLHYTGYSFLISSKGFFIYTIPQTYFCYISHGALA